MKVLHISPTYFDEESTIGGAERYLDELTAAMARQVEVSVLSFGKPRQFERRGVRYIIKKPMYNIAQNKLNPISLGILPHIKKADIVHCHQIFTALSEISLTLSFPFKKKVFMTDHGGGGKTFFMHRGLSKRATALLCVSRYSAHLLKRYHSHRIPIYGGVNTAFFKPSPQERIANSVVTFGRIMRHKGYHHLIKALPESHHLTIIGRVYEEDYYQYLREISQGKNITFMENITDAELLAKINSASLAVFPSTFVDHLGKKIDGEPELFGLSPVESMACNTPTLVSRVGAYPEIAFSQQHLFEDGDIEELKNKIISFSQPDSSNYREHVLQNYTWDLVSQRCLKAYRGEGL